MTEAKFETPVLLMLFNRPEPTAQVAGRIRELHPRRLFLAADGPREDRPGEAELCRAARDAALSAVDWQCELTTRFLDRNLGCRNAVSSHLDWFFDAAEEGIILEDDCLPAPDFFRFAAAMLDRYRQYERVMHIAGANFQNGIRRGSGDWFFSRIPHIWGWASWRRAWRHYDVTMRDLPERSRDPEFRARLPHGDFYRWQLERLFRLTREGAPGFDTWDCQWHYALLAHDGIAANPNVNLVSNIGGSGAHEIDSAICGLPCGKLPAGELRPPADELLLRAFCSALGSEGDVLQESGVTLRTNADAEEFTWRRCYHPTWRSLLRYCADRLTGK